MLFVIVENTLPTMEMAAARFPANSLSLMLRNVLPKVTTPQPTGGPAPALLFLMRLRSTINPVLPNM